MKKKLPRAIRPPTAEMSGADHARDAIEPDTTAPAHPADSHDPSDSKFEATDPVLDRNVVEVAPTAETFSAFVSGALDPPAPSSAETDVARRSWASAIVERYATYSAVGGAVPLPIVNLATTTTIIVRMVRKLSELYNVPFERDRARAIVTGLMGGAMHTGLAAVATSGLLYALPAGNLLGLVLSSIVAAALTRGIGRVFVEHFESGATLQEFPAIEGR